MARGFAKYLCFQSVARLRTRLPQRVCAPQPRIPNATARSSAVGVLPLMSWALRTLDTSRRQEIWLKLARISSPTGGLSSVST